MAASFKDQSIDVLKTQLARVVHGTWERKEDGWWLVQTSDQKKEEIHWHQDLRRKVIQDIIDAAKATIPSKEWTIKDVDQYRQQEVAMQKTDGERVFTSADRRLHWSRAPAGRFSASVFSQLRPEMFPLDSMEPDYQVYSLHGNGIGKDLGLNISPQLGMLDRERYLLEQTGEYSSVQSQSLHVFISMPNAFPAFASLSIYDKKWQLTSYGASSFTATNYRADGELFAPSSVLTETLEALAYRPALDPDTRQPLEASARLQGIWKRINATFADAVNRDPLGLLHGQCWIDYAQEVKKPVLANLCDSQTQREPKMFVPLPVQTHTTIYLKRDDADGWVLGRPIDPIWNRTHRLDRNLLLQYVKLVSRENDATVEEQAMAMDIEDYAITFCSGIPSARLFRHSNQSIENSDGPRLYGAALRAGIRPDPRTGILDIQRLPAYAIGSLQLNFNDGLLSRLGSDEQYDSGICPQIIMPNGLQGLYLKIATTFEPVFEVKDEEDGKLTLYSLDYFASSISDIIDNPAALERLSFRMGSERAVKFSLCLGERSMDETLTDPPMAMVSTTWKTLPAAIKKMLIDKINENPPDPPES